MVLHDVPLAEQALDRAGARRDPMVALSRSAVASEQGHLSAALVHLRGVPGKAARRMTARVTGEIEVLQADLLRREWAGAARPEAWRKRVQPSGAVTSVLHVVSTALPEQQSGYTIRTQGIVTAQRAAGLDAQVVSRLGFPVDMGAIAARPSVTVDGVPYRRLLPRHGIPIPGSARQDEAVAELTALVERLRPQVLHAHSKHENAQIALIVGRRLGLPVVYEARGFLEETWASAGGDTESDFYRWSREAETLCMQRADHVLTLSDAMATDIASRGVPAERITVMPNSVPADFGARSTPAGSVRVQTRAALGIPEEATVFGSVSTVNDYEGFDTVIDALALMKDPDVWVLIVGEGPARTGLSERARSAGVADRVVFTGRVPHAQVRDHLDAIDVFVVPRKATRVTALVPPIKPLEAMAVGIPVLASDLPPLVEIVRPGTFGRIAAAGDPAAWAEQMAALRYAPEDLSNLGTQAADFVAHERTWARAADRYTDVYAAAARR